LRPVTEGAIVRAMRNRRWWIALALLSVLTALTPLAYASPPDPSWIGGLYDDDDFDDAVIFVTSAVSAVESRSPLDVSPSWFYVPGVIVAEPQAPPAPAVPSSTPRAPPLVQS
jgi:hypothetical protein